MDDGLFSRFHLFKARLPIWALVGMLLTACGGGGGGGSSDNGGIPGNNDNSQTVISTDGSGNVGADGGTIKTADGVSVTVPAGALSDTTTIRIASDSGNAPEPASHMTALSPVYEITPHIPYLNGIGKVEIPFDASQLPSGEKAYIMIAKPGGGWVRLDQTVVDGNVAAAGTTHFSYFYVGSLSGYFCTPPGGDNPCGGPKFTAEGKLTGVPAPVITDKDTWKERYRVTEPTHLTATVTIDPQSYQYWAPRRAYCHDSEAEVVVYITSAGPRDGHVIGRGKSSSSVSVSFDLNAGMKGYSTVAAVIKCHFRADKPETCGIIQNEFTSFSGCDPAITVGRVEYDIPPASGTPIIDWHPAGAAVIAGQPASFSVSGSAAQNMTIRWERSDDGGASWGTVQTAMAVTTSTYTVYSTAVTDDGAMFRAELCNNLPDVLPTCVNTAAAVLSVAAAPLAPAFVRQPSDISVIAGQTATFTAVASGSSAPEIRFYRVGTMGNPDEELTVCPSPGVAGSAACSYTTTVLAESDSGSEFYATAGDGSSSTTSSRATLTVTQVGLAPMIVTPPVDVAVPMTGTAMLRVVATGTAPLSYQWRFNEQALQERVAGAGVSGVHGVNSPVLTISNAQTADAGAYSVIISNPYGSVTTDTVSIAVYVAMPTSVVQPGTTAADYGPASTIDSAGNSYLCGTTFGAFDGGQVNGLPRYYLAKYSSTGQQAWLYESPMANVYVGASGIATDSAGNVFVAGEVLGDLETNVADSVPRAFLAKYGATGSLLWRKQFGNGAEIHAGGLRVDSTGSLYVSGTTSGAFNGYANDAGIQDVFVGKFDSDGNVLWVRQLQSGALSDGGAITLDGSGSVYVAGWTQGAFPGFSAPPVNTWRAEFAAKYDTNGNLQWLNQFSDVYGAHNVSIAADTAGSVFVGGPFEGMVKGSYVMGLMARKLDATTGVPNWSRQYGVGNLAYQSGINASATDAAGHYYLTGATAGAFEGYTNAGAYDVMLLKIDSNGALVGVRQVGSDANDVGQAVAVRGDGAPVVSGYTEGSLDGYANRGFRDAFMMRFDPF